MKGAGAKSAWLLLVPAALALLCWAAGASRAEEAPSAEAPSLPQLTVLQRYTDKSGLPSNHVTCVYVDDRDAWVGTADAGVARFNFDEGNWLVTKVEDGLSSNGVTGIIGFQGRIYVGTQEAINVWDGFTWSVEKEAGPVRLANTVFRVQDGLLWAAARTMRGGLVTFDGKAWKNRSTLEVGTILNNVSDFAFSGTTLWVGTTNRGVLRFGKEGLTTFMTSDGLSSNFVYAIAVRGEDAYVGGCCGVSARRGGTWVVYDVPQGLPSAVVKTVAIDPGGAVWFGTDKGLAVFDGSEFLKFGKAQGLTDDRITSVSFQGNEVWVGTQGGLNRLERAY